MKVCPPILVRLESLRDLLCGKSLEIKRLLNRVSWLGTLRKQGAKLRLFSNNISFQGLTTRGNPHQLDFMGDNPWNTRDMVECLRGRPARCAGHLGPLVINPVTGHVTNPSRPPSPSQSAEDTRDIPEMPVEPLEGPQPLQGFVEFMEMKSPITQKGHHGNTSTGIGKTLGKKAICLILRTNGIITSLILSVSETRYSKHAITKHT